MKYRCMLGVIILKNGIYKNKVMNKKAIVVYVDDKEKTLEEFTWLYKTWKLNDLDTEYDLVVYGPYQINNKLYTDNNLIFREMNSIPSIDSFWKGYDFVNSFGMFNDDIERNWILRYDFILKTDCDVFLTENLRGLDGNKLHIGFGGYMMEEIDEIQKNLIDIASELNLKYKHINHIGASLYGKTSDVIKITFFQFKLTKLILIRFGNTVGSWPGWFRGVSSMYAIHLSVNHICDLINIKLNVLDEFCGSGVIDKSTYHIHAWHYEGYFSKHKWFKGEYDKLIVYKIPTIVNEYCHWVVSNSLDEMLKIKQINLRG